MTDDETRMAEAAYLRLQERLTTLAWPESGQPVFGAEALQTLHGAYAFASMAHSTNKPRLSGEPYITHPIAVAELLAELGMRELDGYIAALLHDVVEDTPRTLQDVRAAFGGNVATLVDGLTKIKKISTLKTPEEEQQKREEAQAQNVMKMLLTSMQDRRVLIIKLADRLHNMRTLAFKSEKSQRRIANETMHIYVPIADILGIRLYKEELEDLAIRYLDNQGYHEIEKWLSKNAEERDCFLQRIQTKLRQHLERCFVALRGVAPPMQVQGRVKSVHSIYRKHNEQMKEFGEIFDIYALRVVVETEGDCWAVLGWIHEIFREVPDRFKNYLSCPKQNGYQSLHVTMLSEDGIPFEVQIRTFAMHEVAEHGVAAHWKYKLGIKSEDTAFEQCLAGIQELLESYVQAGSAEDVLRSLRSDIAPADKVYPMTPQGDIKELRQGATVLDFAYAVHSNLGHRFGGAKINGKIVNIDTKVQSGDIVEIQTQAHENPSRNWLKVAQTSRARGKISGWFKNERRDENIHEGKRLAAIELQRNCARVLPKDRAALLLRVLRRKQAALDAKKSDDENLEDFYSNLGCGQLNFSSMLPMLREEYHKLLDEARQEEEQTCAEPHKFTHEKGIILEGIEGCGIKLAQCCQPVPGDAIVGYLTRSAIRGGDFMPGGVSVHKRNCLHVPSELSKAPEPDRYLPARWSPTARAFYKSTLTVGVRRRGMFKELSAQLTRLRVEVYSIAAAKDTEESGGGAFVLSFGVRDRTQLEYVRTKLQKLSGVTHVS